MSTATTMAPHCAIDLFAPESLRDPYEDYRRVRDLGPVVRLQHPDVVALGRFATVQYALRQPEIFVSGEGVGFNETFNAVRRTNIIQSDGDLHRRLRSAVIRPLMPAAVTKIRAELKRLIEVQVEKLVAKGEFDAMIELARYLPVEAVAHFVGLPPDGRERLLDWASAAFNAIGPEQEPGDLERLAEARAYIAGVRPGDVQPGSWAAHLFDSVAAERLTMEDAMAALSAYVLPSLDTTINAKGLLLYNLARSPDQWALLKSEPKLIGGAVLEGVRHSTPIRWFSRIAAQSVEIEGVAIPQGARIMLMYASANRDERRYPDPDRFDIKRDSRDHLAWGTGPHMCVGMHLARVEMEVMLEALIERGVTLSAGKPEVGTNRGLYGLTSLPFRLS